MDNFIQRLTVSEKLLILCCFNCIIFYDKLNKTFVIKSEVNGLIIVAIVLAGWTTLVIKRRLSKDAEHIYYDIVKQAQQKEKENEVKQQQQQNELSIIKRRLESVEAKTGS